MVQWEGSKQTGLSPYQTAGEVSGSYIVRPSDVPENEPYITRGMNEGYAPSDIRPFTFKKPSGYKQYYGRLAQERAEGRTNIQYVATKEEGERYQKYMQQGRQEPFFSIMDRLRQQRSNIEIRKPTTYQLPIFQSQQRYQPPPKRYYAVNYFGENIAHQYKSGEKFKILGLFPYGEPKPGKQYKSDILGFTHEAGEVKEESIRSAMERGALEGVSTTDLKLRQLGNLLAVSPFIIKYPYLKSSVSISKGKPPLEKMFGSKTFVSQKKAFGGQTYYVEPKPAAQQIRTPILNKMFGGTAKPAPKVNVLKNMFGTSAYQKPRKTSVMDILLVQPSRQRQIVRPAESMWRQVISKPSELKPRTDFEEIYKQQAIRNILQYTKLSKVSKPAPQVTVAKPIKTYGVMEQIRLENKIRLSPQSFKPALRTISGTQYKFMLGMGASSRLLSGLMQGQRQEQGLRQLFGQQQTQAQRQTFKQRFAYDFSFKYPTLPKIRTSLQPQSIFKTPARQPPKTPPPRRPIREPLLFRTPKIPPVYIPKFEMPAIFGKGRKKKQGITEKVIVTRMLSLKDLLGR